MREERHQPLVSVAMATYNCRDTVEEALASIAGQTFANWELVVCDDGSTDGTPEVLDQFAREYPDRVTVLRNESNAKLAYSLNRCLAHVRGQFVARMDGDDRSVPERFERQVEHLLAHPEIDLVGTAMQRFDDSGLADVLTLAASPTRSAMRTGVAFAHATIMARREVFDTLGGYTDLPRTVRCEDYDLWFRFLGHGFLGHNLDTPLYQVREDANAVRRRTFASRWARYQTGLVGFRQLGYPWHWYAAPTIALLKGFVPVRGVLAYRTLQHRRHVRRENQPIGTVT